jgi:CheY-like chemotaxis protein
MAHDFNNLLTAINGYAELASSRLTPGHPAAAMLEEIRKAGDRAAAITGRLLELGRGKDDTSLAPRLTGWGPAPAGPKEKAGAPDRSTEPSGIARETVLVVDDDESIRHLAASVLRSEGYEVLEASGAREAMFLHEQHRDSIHTLLTDVIMPGRSGRDLALELQRRRPGIRTVFMSGYTGDILLEQGLETSRALFLGKPFTPAGLLAKLAEARSMGSPDQAMAGDRR